jgi:hypothetical protein
MQWLKDMWRKLFPVEYVYVLVPKDLKTRDITEGRGHRFLTEMSQAVKACPVVFEEMLRELERAQAALERSHYKTVDEFNHESIQAERIKGKIEVCKKFLNMPMASTNALALRHEQKEQDKKKVDELMKNTMWGAALKEPLE